MTWGVRIEAGCKSEQFRQANGYIGNVSFEEQSGTASSSVERLFRATSRLTWIERTTGLFDHFIGVQLTIATQPESGGTE